MVGAVAEALEHSLESQRLAKEANSLELELSVGVPYWMDLLGDTKAAIEVVTERIERMGTDYDLGRQVIGFSAVIWSTMFLGLLLLENGRIDEARPLNDRSLELAREHDDIETLGWTHNQYALLDYPSGETRDGLAHARAGAEIAERTGSAFQRATAYSLLGFAHLSRGEWVEAIEAEEEALQIMSDMRTGMQYEPLSLAALAEAQLGLDDPEGASETSKRGAEVAARYGMRTHEGQCRMVLGRALTRSRPTEARAELDRALELIGADYVALEPRIHEALADLAAIHGPEQSYERQLRVALEGYERIGATGHARRLRERLAGRTGMALE